MLRKIITLNIGLMLMIIIGACGDGAKLDSSDNKSNKMAKQADLVLLGGDIATVDPDYGNVSAMAINDYKITAFAAFEESFKGSLTPGKYADFIVLSKNLLTIEDNDIPSTEIDMTYVGGELKYQR